MATVKTFTCSACGISWQEEGRKGRPPKFCTDCKGNPKKIKQVTEEEKRAAASTRINNLETALKASGNHLSQQKKERRSFSLAEMDERIHQLEEWRKSVEQGGEFFAKSPPRTKKASGR